MMGDGTGSGGSSLTSDRSGYLLTSIPTTLSGEDEGTKLSGVSRPPPWSWILRDRQTQRVSRAHPALGASHTNPAPAMCVTSAQQQQPKKPRIGANQEISWGKKTTNVFNYKVISMLSFLLTKALASECKDLPKKEDD